MKVFCFLILVLSCNNISSDIPSTLQKQVEAFNSKNVDAMLVNLDSSFVWYDVYPDTTQIQVKGIAAFKSAMVMYFRDFSTVRAQLSDISIVGSYISFKETVSWNGKDGSKKKQSALGVYQIKKNKIYRVWYYY